jgi:hypothetical protein
MAREVLLTGSVPRQPASEVFRLAERYLRPRLSRLPDGEQGGWGGGNVARTGEHPQLRPGRKARMTTAGTPFGRFPEMTMHGPRRLGERADGEDHPPDRLHPHADRSRACR